MAGETQKTPAEENDPLAAFDEAFSSFSEPGDDEPAAKPVVDDEPAVPASSDGDDADAAAAAEADDGDDADVDGEPGDDEGDEGAAAAEAEEGDADAEGDEGGEEPPAEPAAAKADEPPAKEDESDDVIRRLAELVKDKPKEESKDKTEDKPAEQQDEPLYTEEEQALLNQYQEDWPEVAKAEQLMRRGEYRQIVGYIFNEIAKEIRPMMEQLQAVTQHTHLSQIQERVTDYDDVRDKVVDWVETQPEYLQDAYKRVIDNGTVEEVADLIDRYKRETGQNAEPAPPQQQDTELPKTTKKAAASLAPVRSKRSAIPKSEDPQDFDAAFERFADNL